MTPTTSLSLPTRVEDIDPATVTALVQAGGVHARALSLDVMEVMWGTATKVRLQIAWDEPGRAAGLPERLILKGGFAEHGEAMSAIYAIEARFYDTFQPVLGVNSPRCLGVLDDAARHQHLVLLEDLDTRAVRFHRVLDPVPPERVRAFLDLLACLHGRTWELRDDPARYAGLHRWQALPTDAMGEYARGQLVPETWSRFMRLPRALAVSRLFHDSGRMEAALRRIDAFTAGQPRCLVHGDFHLGNLYDDADGAPAALDWQSYCVGHWSHDVTYFMVSALDMAVRRRGERDLLAFYLDRLADNGGSPPSLEEAMAAYRLQLADGLFYWMVNPPEWQAEENNCAVAPRFADAALDHGLFDDL